MNKKKKKDTLTWVALLIYCFVGAGMGFLMTNVSESPGINNASTSGYIAMLCLILVMLYLAFLTHIIIHEAGHFIFGRLTGYTFSSFRIGSLLWMKDGGKLRMKKYILPGTGGQCLMRPPKQMKGQYPVVLYNLGGSILNFIFAVLFFILSFEVDKSRSPLVYFYCIAMIFVGVALAIINGIPMSSAMVDNDGKNAILLRKNKEARQALWTQLEINHLITTGVPLTEMPSEWFTRPFDEDMDNPLVASIAVFRCNYLLDKNRFAQAKAEMLELIHGDFAVSAINKAMLINDIIYCELIDGCNKETIDTLLTKEQKKMSKALKAFPCILRTEYVYALIYEQDMMKADKLKKSFEKIAKQYPYQVSVEADRNLITHAENIINNHKGETKDERVFK